jgi:hypothetical protein
VSSPLLSWMQLPKKAVDTVTAPINAFQEKFPGLADMLGIHADPQQQPQQADPGMVREANQSFVDAMNRQKAQPKQNLRGGR